MRSHVWMAVGLGVGLALGLVAALTQSPLLLALTQWLRPLGTLFLNLLSMVVIPLVGTALFAGVAGLGDLRRVGRLGMRTLGFFWGTTLAAIVIGFAVAALCLPFAAITPQQQAALRLAAAADSGFVRHAAEQIPTGARFIVELIPANPVRAAVDGNLLPVIVFTTIFAVAAAALPDDKRRTLTDLADVATQALIRIVHWVLLVAPLGILALVAGAVAQHGWALVKTMAVFVLAVIAGLALFIAVVLLPAVVLVARLGGGGLLRAGPAAGVVGFFAPPFPPHGPPLRGPPPPPRLGPHPGIVRHLAHGQGAPGGSGGGPRRGGEKAGVPCLAPAGSALFLALPPSRSAPRRPRLTAYPPQP